MPWWVAPWHSWDRMILKPRWSALVELVSLLSACCFSSFFFFWGGVFFLMKVLRFKKCNGIFFCVFCMNIFRSICNYKYIPNCESKLFLGRNSSKANPSLLVFSWGANLSLIIMFSFSQEHLFHLHLGRLTWFTWECTPGKGKASEPKHHFQVQAVNLRGKVCRNQEKTIGGSVPWWWPPMTSGVPMRSLKHFEVAQLTRMRNGRHSSNRWNCIYYIDMMDGIYGVMVMDGNRLK